MSSSHKTGECVLAEDGRETGPGSLPRTQVAEQAGNIYHPREKSVGRGTKTDVDSHNAATPPCVSNVEVATPQQRVSGHADPAQEAEGSGLSNRRDSIDLDIIDL